MEPIAVEQTQEKITPEMMLARIDAITVDTESIRKALDELQHVEFPDDWRTLDSKLETERDRYRAVARIIEAREQTNREMIDVLHRLIEQIK